MTSRTSAATSAAPRLPGGAAPARPGDARGHAADRLAGDTGTRGRRPSRFGGCGGGRRRGGGFTLIEVLVVLGIIILLAALVMPLILRSFGRATSIKMAADLAAISAALEAYRQDHFAYPQVRRVPNPVASPGPVERPNPPMGAEILCWALIGPAPATEPNPPMNVRLRQDGLEGPGFRTRAGGRAYPPYLNPEQFKIGVPFSEPLNVSMTNVLQFCILDRNDFPILYFPASPTNPNVRIPAGGTNPQPYVDAKEMETSSEASRFDARDNLRFVEATDVALGLRKIRLLFGDRNTNGYIDGQDEPIDLPFVLWSAGPDDFFGPRPDDATDRATLDWNDVGKCDDVTNFR
jgi:type II secretory pathway pseudopilin PulG